MQLIKTASKTCALDPLPSSVPSQCIEALAPLITNIINMSITQSDIPELLKEAVVRPLLRKPSLDVDVLSNYRPVSNLPQLSKVLEKVTAKQIQEHIFAMSELYQSAYKSCHSTETALICVCDDMKLVFDKRIGTALIMIDLSAAFDTINHDILLRRLCDRYGTIGDALKWVKFYSTNRSQRISINEYSSCGSLLSSSGVPQGSVLGPLIFSLYVQPVGDIIRKHELSFHHYADDLQMYTSFQYDHHSFSTSLVKLQCCVSELQKWFSANHLIMNDDKTEFIPFVQKNDIIILWTNRRYASVMTQSVHHSQ